MGGVLVLLVTPAGVALGTERPVHLTLLHTNDLHSHLRPEKSPLGLGGVARLKTLVDREKLAAPHSFLLDGGDWSEGDIYFREGAGVETLRMMDHLGYDAVVIGNHDWLNGPEALLSILERATPRFGVVAANVDASDFPRSRDFARLIPPYVIRETGGLRVAFIGLVTFEFIYDSFLKPVDITQPFAATRDLAARLKDEADLVVVISHNKLDMNAAVLRAAPDVDVVIGGHDHRKTTVPVVVERSGVSPGYVVEAGCWGRYLGKLDLRVLPRAAAAEAGTPRVELSGYRLIQVDSAIPEDPATLRRVERLESLLEGRYGPIFRDHVATNHAEIERGGPESLMGNFATDAYKAATGADFALDQSALIYGEIHPGELTSADVYNSNPGVYDPTTDRSWTLKLIPIKGRTLKWLLNVLFSTRQLAELGILSASGLELAYDPILQQRRLNTPPPASAAGFLAMSSPGQSPGLTPVEAAETGSVIQDVLIGGRPLERDAVYRLAASGGMELAVRYLNGIIPRAVPLEGMTDTGIESWRAMADHARALSPITAAKIPVGNRIRSIQADHVVLGDDISVHPISRESGDHLRARVRVTVRNFGRSPALGAVAGVGPSVTLRSNAHRIDTTRDPNWVALGPAQPVGLLEPQGSQSFEWEVLIPGARGLYSVAAEVDGMVGEVNRANNTAIRWISFP